MNKRPLGKSRGLVCSGDRNYAALTTLHRLAEIEI
jgi:hypothetical protein